MVFSAAVFGYVPFKQFAGFKREFSRPFCGQAQLFVLGSRDYADLTCEFGNSLRIELGRILVGNQKLCLRLARRLFHLRKHTGLFAQAALSTMCASWVPTQALDDIAETRASIERHECALLTQPKGWPCCFVGC